MRLVFFAPPLLTPQPPQLRPVGGGGGGGFGTAIAKAAVSAISKAQRGRGAGVFWEEADEHGERRPLPYRSVFHNGLSCPYRR